MKLFFTLLFLPIFAVAEMYLDSGAEGGSAIHNEAGWDISSADAMNPLLRNFNASYGCKGNQCSDQAKKQFYSDRNRINRMRYAGNASILYDFLSDKGNMTWLEIVVRLGVNEQTDAALVRDAGLIINEIKESQRVNESKTNYLKRQSSYMQSDGNPQRQMQKCNIMADLVARVLQITGPK